jgi:protein gp37
MAKKKSIEWADDQRWNFFTGCTKVSEGCKHCYAESTADWLHRMGNSRYINRFKFTVHEDKIDAPLSWPKPREGRPRIFVNSMSDFFHEQAPEPILMRAFDVMRQRPDYDFLILTKREDRLAEMDPWIDWPANVWQGVSVENAKHLDRIDRLQETSAPIKWLSLEPLLGPLPNLDLRVIDWVVVGGESGDHARPMREEWALDLRDQCVAQGVPFFLKQIGGRDRVKGGRLLQGREWNEFLKENQSRCMPSSFRSQRSLSL